MKKFQLWSRDEYGQGSILFTSENIDEVVKVGKNKVTEVNVHNALTVSDRDRNWEAYMVMIDSSNKKKIYKQYVYGGWSHRTNKNVYGIKDNGEIDNIFLPEIQDPVIRIYLGDISTNRNIESDWYAMDAKQNIIDTIHHPDLRDKTVYFVVMIED